MRKRKLSTIFESSVQCDCWKALKSREMLSQVLPRLSKVKYVMLSDFCLAELRTESYIFLKSLDALVIAFVNVSSLSFNIQQVKYLNQ
jgi:hypothetical protein